MMRNVTRSIHQPETVRNQISIFLKDNLYKVGVSTPTKNFLQIRSAYTQAQNAYRLGSARFPDYWYYKFEDYILDYVLYKASEEIPAELLCPSAFQILSRYDDSNHTELLHSLRIYIQEKYNATHAAKALFVHRTTFPDRLERIQKSFQPDSFQTFSLPYSVFTIIQIIRAG